MKWSFFNGISPSMIPDYGYSLFRSEAQCGLTGFIRLLEECEYPSRGRALALYAESNLEEYSSYWKESLGEYAAVPFGYEAIETYLVLTGRADDFKECLADKAALLANHMNGFEIQDRLVEEQVAPLFENARFSRLYLYRDRDHRGIMAMRNEE